MAGNELRHVENSSSPALPEFIVKALLLTQVNLTS